MNATGDAIAQMHKVSVNAAFDSIVDALVDGCCFRTFATLNERKPKSNDALVIDEHVSVDSNSAISSLGIARPSADNGSCWTNANVSRVDHNTFLTFARSRNPVDAVHDSVPCLLVTLAPDQMWFFTTYATYGGLGMRQALVVFEYPEECLCNPLVVASTEFLHSILWTTALKCSMSASYNDAMTFSNTKVIVGSYEGAVFTR